MSQNRSRTRAAYGAPDDQKEVVVTVDRRLLFGVALLAVFGVALGVGVLANRRGAAPASAGLPAAQATPLPQGIDEASAKATAAALGLGESVTIVDTGIERSTAAPDAMAGAPPIVGDLATSMPGSSIDLDLENFAPTARAGAENWTPDVLANIQDPNLSADYRPFRVEDYDEPITGGPRLAVKDLSPIWTYNFGDVNRNASVQRDFVVKNIGDADLIISRVYTGCGCTTTRIGDVPIDGAGNLPQPYVLKPWEEVPFTVEFDARLSQEQGSLAKYIQIFSNDDTKVVFDDAAPELSHETRFRIVVRPVSGTPEVPSDDAKRATETAGG